jgi:predicted nucleotidyltransferase
MYCRVAAMLRPNGKVLVAGGGPKAMLWPASDKPSPRNTSRVAGRPGLFAPILLWSHTQRRSACQRIQSSDSLYRQHRALATRRDHPRVALQPSGHLQANEQAALQEFTARLLQGGDGRVVSVWLFGSKARGDFEPDSDLDLLIVLEEAAWIIRDRVHLLAARVSLEHDVLINTHLVSRACWTRMARQHATLWQQVRRDGFPLRFGVASTQKAAGRIDTAQQPTGSLPP